MSMDNKELINSFVQEANEGLADIENDLLNIEAAGAAVDPELVNKVFRTIHSIKGTSGFIGLRTIGTLAHEMENVLNMIRNKELAANSAITDALLAGADKLRTMVGNVDDSNNESVTEQIERLKHAMVSPNPTEEELEDQADLDREIDIELPTGDLAFMMIRKRDLVSAQKQKQHIYVIEVDFITDVQSLGRTPIEFLNTIYSKATLIDSYVSTAGLTDLANELPDRLMFRLLIGSSSSATELSEFLRVPRQQIFHIATPEQRAWNGQQTPPVAASAVEPTPAPAAVAPTAVQPVAAKPASTPAVSETPAPAVAPSAPATPTSSHERDAQRSSRPPAADGASETSVRVHVKVLDNLMTLAGELVLARNQLLQSIEAKELRGIESVGSKLDQVTSELQETIMQTRMQPIANVFNKFPRVVRDLSANLKKQCELTLEGKEVELDKAIIEAIGDPLTHLVRNAVDHGIETPDKRTAAGKHAAGTIVLSASHQAGKVTISIADDGAGMDAAKLKTKAIDKGLITPEQARDMTDRDALKLIFAPGFSTAEKVTDVSGRGVGMDVVRTNIERLGGTVDIETRKGAGSVISIQLPLTLAIIPSLIVRCGTMKYAIPQVNINELVRVKASDIAKRIEKIKSAEVLRLRGSLLPLVRLTSALKVQSMYADATTGELHENHRASIADRRGQKMRSLIPSERRDASDRRDDTPAGALNIIVVETGQVRYGLIVDGLDDSEEIVVKPLGRHLKDNRAFAGATILGDGTVALILDVTGIAQQAELRIVESRKQIEDAAAQEQARNTDTLSMVMFTNDPKEYFGVPMGLIARIERIRCEQIDAVGGQEVLQYRGISLPLIALENYVRANARPELPTIFVVVFKIGGREAGLIVPNLVDIRQVDATLDTSTFREQGVMGSMIIDGKAVRIIDLFELATQALPDVQLAAAPSFGPSTSPAPMAIAQAAATPSGAPAQPAPRSGKPRILVAEDSGFFRSQMVKFFEAAGYDVTACEDGQIAWNTLSKGTTHFDMVVTDIEMPNMNGYELTEHIRADQRFLTLPVIAVTSLAGEEDMQRGLAAGVTEYHVKLDRDMLLTTVARYIQEAIAQTAQNA